MTAEPAARPSRSGTDDEAFKRELVQLIPHLRAFARTLCGDPAAADDLAQDAMMKAWDARASFQMGTNMKAWTFMILRNQFYSEKRRSWRQSQLDQEAAERTLVAQAGQWVGCRKVAQVRERPESFEAAPRLCGEQRQQIRDLGIRISDGVVDRQQHAGDAVTIVLDADRDRDQRTDAKVGQHLPSRGIELVRVAEGVGRTEAFGSTDESTQLFGVERGDPFSQPSGSSAA